MLQCLKIKNFLLIKNQEISFDGNFTVITGETGSGKSMLIKALHFVLGEKVDNLEHHCNDQEISVIAQFVVDKNENITKILSDNAIEIEDNLIILRRTLNGTNKGKNFINDTPVTIKFLKKISEELVEFHSQHKQLEAFNQSNCLNIIDQFVNNIGLLEKISKYHQKITKLELEIEAKIKEKEELENNKEFIEYSFKEIEHLNLKEGEELDLIEKKKLFNDKIKITKAISSLLDIFENDNGVINQIGKVQREFIKMEHDLGINDQIDMTIFHLNELYSLAEKKLKDFDLEENIENIEERLSKIKELSRKYRCTSDQLIEFAKEEKNKLNILSDINQDIKDKAFEKDKALKEYFVEAEKLSMLRAGAAKKLEEKILTELNLLKLEQVEFKIEISSDALRPINVKGIDQIKFLIKTNKGFSFSEVSETASGGELSRIMLALKVSLAEVNLKSTIIFDEIDSGTGGAVAQVIGNRMKKLSSSNQIIAISHQPQVASKASQHLLVEKFTDKITESKIKTLTQHEKIQEIARMLAGINVTESAIKAAESLIEEL